MKISMLAHPVLFFICYEALLQQGFVQRPTKYHIPTGYVMCVTLTTFSCTFQPAEINIPRRPRNVFKKKPHNLTTYIKYWTSGTYVKNKNQVLKRRTKYLALLWLSSTCGSDRWRNNRWWCKVPMRFTCNLHNASCLLCKG